MDWTGGTIDVGWVVPLLPSVPPPPAPSSKGPPPSAFAMSRTRKVKVGTGLVRKTAGKTAEKVVHEKIVPEKVVDKATASACDSKKTVRG